ncbi:MAG: hypothetical protein Q8M16_10210 [Pirellulaceae bacterium]|nr:hypothetical protein [Pirellulaceae bacterium]
MKNFKVGSCSCEWTLDQYLENGYSGLVGPDVNPPLTVVVAWQRSPNETPCVLRGGGHYHDPHECRSASRWASDEVSWKDHDPDHPKSPFWYTSEEATVGFRIIRPLVPPQTRDAREEAWTAAYPSITKNARKKIEQEGRGVLLPIQPEFAEEIRKARQQILNQQSASTLGAALAENAGVNER